MHARRLLLAAGAWLKPVAAFLGVELPVRVRINTVSVTERMPPLIHHIVGHATGLLTMKQKPNGTVLIGGGWQGRGTPQEGRGEVTAETLDAHCRRSGLANFKRPRRYVFLDELPKSPVGKLLRRKLVAGDYHEIESGSHARQDNQEIRSS